MNTLYYIYRAICKYFGVYPTEELITVRQSKYILRYCASEDDVCRAISELRYLLWNVAYMILNSVFAVWLSKHAVRDFVFIDFFLFFISFVIKLFTQPAVFGLVNNDLHNSIRATLWLSTKSQR